MLLRHLSGASYPLSNRSMDIILNSSVSKSLKKRIKQATELVSL